MGSPTVCAKDSAAGEAEMAGLVMVSVTGTVMGDVPPVTVISA